MVLQDISFIESTVASRALADPREKSISRNQPSFTHPPPYQQLTSTALLADPIPVNSPHPPSLYERKHALVYIWLIQLKLSFNSVTFLKPTGFHSSSWLKNTQACLFTALHRPPIHWRAPRVLIFATVNSAMNSMEVSLCMLVLFPWGEQPEQDSRVKC